jgi:hypothetical protein
MLKAKRGAALSAEEAEKAYHGILYFIDGLEKYAGWIRDKEGKPFPMSEKAIAEINAEIREYRSLALRLYSECFTICPAASTTPASGAEQVTAQVVQPIREAKNHPPQPIKGE